MPSNKIPGANLAFLAGLGCTALVFPTDMPVFVSDTKRAGADEDWAALAADWQRVGGDLAMAVDRVVGHPPTGGPIADGAAAS